MRFPFIICLFSISVWHCTPSNQSAQIMTVQGLMPASQMGISLIHEHVLVDFIGADSTHSGRWDRQEVFDKVMPYLLEVKQLGCQTIVECTPAYLGRDPLLLKMLADSSGLTILTNTGYYGAVDNKFLPPHAYTETPEQLAARWIAEWKDGIDGTGIRPGFIKISVNPDTLSELHEKLVRAAALTHLATGLTIASHTGPAIPAFEELAVLEEEGVDPSAFIWVHAQNEKDLAKHIAAASRGAWISFDGVRTDNIMDYVKRLTAMKEAGLLDRVLISHDAGWYRPGEPDGGTFRGYTAIFQDLLPALRQAGFSELEVKQLMMVNPVEAFGL